MHRLANGVSGFAVGDEHGEREVAAELHPFDRERDLDAIHRGEPLAIGGCDPPKLAKRVVEPCEPCHRERRPRLVDPEVEAQAGHVVGLGVAAVAVPRDRGHRVRAELAELGRELLGVRDHDPALANAELRLREEREAAADAGGPRARAVAELAAVGLRAVLDQGDPALVRDRAEGVDVGRVAEHVDGDDRLRPLGDEALDVRGVHQRLRRRDAVGEHGFAARDAAGVRVGDERERRRDHLVARPDAGGETGHVERGGGTRDGYRVPGARVLAERLLELERLRAHREPAGAKRVEDGLDVRLRSEISVSVTFQGSLISALFQTWATDSRTAAATWSWRSRGMCG